MSGRHLAKEQPDSFAFSKEAEKQVKAWIAKYPKGKERSAVIPLLWIAQKDNGGWLSEPAMRAVGERLGMAPIRVLEVATFYTMFKLAPVGEHLIQVCGTTPCMLRGAEKIKTICKRRIGEKGVMSADGKFTWEEVECLGACVNAPMVQVSNAAGDHYYEDLDEAAMEKLLDDLAAGRQVAPGPQDGRHASEPLGGAQVLTDKTLYNGSRARPLKSIPNAPKTEKPKAARKTPAAEKAPAKAATKPAKPKLLKAARKGLADDLKRIAGLGPRIESALNALGVFHYDQIASWTKAEAAWIEEQIKARGRIARDKWIAQAKALMKGEGK